MKIVIFYRTANQKEFSSFPVKAKTRKKALRVFASAFALPKPEKDAKLCGKRYYTAASVVLTLDKVGRFSN